MRMLQDRQTNLLSNCSASADKGAYAMTEGLENQKCITMRIGPSSTGGDLQATQQDVNMSEGLIQTKVSRERHECRFPRCRKGIDGRAYVTPEEIEDLHLRIQDMRLHGTLHMTGVYEKTVNEASVNKYGNEETSGGKESGNHCERLEGSVRRLGHHVHDSTKWVELQGKGQPIVESL